MKILISKPQPNSESELARIAMTCYDQQIDPNGQYKLVRFFMKRYFRPKSISKRKEKGVLQYVLLEDQKVCGFYELEESGLLASLYILPEKQHLGYGKQLVLHAMKMAKAKGLEKITLDATEYGKDFYLHLGFVPSNPSQKVIFKITVYPMEKAV